MPETKKTPDRRVVRTKRAIKNAFARLLTEKDVNDITVSDVAALADINRKTFYNYYAGIHEVVGEIEDDLVLRLDAVLTEVDVTESMKRPYMLFEKLTTVINTDMDFFGFLLSMNANVSLTTKLADLLKAKFKSLLQDSLDLEEEKLDLMLEFAVTGVVAVYRRWFNSDRREPIDDISAEINTMLFRGLNGFLSLSPDSAEAPL
jgi:AcrR family transcriptional regulator